MADLYYIDSDYFTPDSGYYVYIANAEATLTSSATVTCVIGLLQSVSASVSANFTPTLTVEVLKNHTALIDAVVTMSTVAVVNRSITQTLDSIANVNAMADRTRGYSSSISSASTLSALVGKIQTAQSAQSSTASLTAVGGYRKQVSSSISSTANLTARAFKSYERPQMLKQTVGTVSIDTTNKKFGSGSLTWNGTSRYLEYYFGDQYPDTFNQGIVIDFWAANFDSGSTASILRLGNDANNYLDFYVDASEQLGVRFINSSGTSTGIFTPSASTSISGSTFKHVRVVGKVSSSVATAGSLYIDGTRISTGSLSSNQWWQEDAFPAKTLLKIGSIQNLSTSGNIDDLRILFYYVDGGQLDAAGYSPSETTQSVPSAQFQNDDTATNILLHFNGDFLDDASGIKQASATLSSTITVSASAIVSKVASAALSSSASLTAITKVLKEATATASSESTLTVDIIRIREATAVLESAATVSALVGVIKQFALTELSAFNTGIDVVAQLAGVALLESFVSLSATAIKTVDGVQSLSTAFSLSAIPTTTSGASANLTSEFTQTTSAERIRETDSNISASTTLAVDIVKVRQFAADLNSSVSMTTVIDHFVGFIVLKAGSFSLTADASRTRDLISTPASTATLSATATRIQTATAALSSSATVVATAAVTSNTVINLAALATSSITAVKTAVATPVLDSIATQLTVAVKNATGTVTLESTASLTALVGVIKPFIGANSTLGILGQTENDLNNGGFVKYTGVTSGLATSVVFSWWMARPIGVIFDANPNRSDVLTIPLMFASTLRIESSNLIYASGGGQVGAVVSDGGQVAWNLASVGLNDNVYHHYLLVIDLSKSLNQDKYRLYVDDVEFGISGVQYRVGAEYFTAPNPYNLPLGIDTQYNLMMNTGYDGQYIRADELSDGFGNPGSSLHQFYWDWGNTYNIDDAGYRSKFYQDGWRDLGIDGTNTGLSQPKHYVRLNDYTDIQDTGTELSSGSWKQLSFVEDVAGNVYDRWQSNLYIPSISDNGSAFLGNKILVKAFLTATPVAVLLITANLSSTAAITVNASKQVAAEAALSTVASLTATANTFTGVIANLTSTATLSATATRIQTASANISSTATIVAIVGQFEQADANLTATATLVCEATEILPISGSADLSSAFTLIADAIAFSGVASTMEVFATVSVDITVKPPIRITATLQSTATMTVIVGAIEQFAVLAASSGTLSITFTRIKRTAVSMNSAGSLTASVRRTRTFTATLSAQGFILTTGTIINIDPYLTLVVAAESRYYYVLPENRVRIVDSETRVNIV